MRDDCLQFRYYQEWVYCQTALVLSQLHSRATQMKCIRVHHFPLGPAHCICWLILTMPYLSPVFHSPIAVFSLCLWNDSTLSKWQLPNKQKHSNKLKTPNTDYSATMTRKKFNTVFSFSSPNMYLFSIPLGQDSSLYLPIVVQSLSYVRLFPTRGKQEVMAGLQERTSGSTGRGQVPDRFAGRCGKLETERNHRGFLKLGNFSHSKALSSTSFSRS